MGVINVTPDSFSDGGKALHPEGARDIAMAMEAAGADLIDIGAESTRPGAPPVGGVEELSRLVPALQALAGRISIPVSVDTYKSEVAAAAIDHGAAMVNDISGFAFDPRLGPLVASRGVPAVLMHTRGRPQDMAANADYDDVVAEVVRELQKAVGRARSAGVAEDRLIIDPGIGFAKRAEHSMRVLAEIDGFAELGLPILVGPSRKSFMTSATGPLSADERDWPTAAAVTAAILGGAHIVRVHNVAKMVHVVRVADALRGTLLLRAGQAG
jgi:dihydropteroate synthase